MTSVEKAALIAWLTVNGIGYLLVRDVADDHPATTVFGHVVLWSTGGLLVVAVAVRLATG